MNTKKFEVEYSEAKFHYGELELRACVSTDIAHHYVRQKMDREDAPLWADMGRKYTPAQEKHIRFLFNHHEPIARKVMNDWLAAHNFPSLEEHKAKKARITLSVTAAGEVSNFVIWE